jgi:conjugative transfer region lipoprotein (TIGR03751 family)
MLARPGLGGCATSKDKLLPHGDSTMLDVWNRRPAAGAGGQAARQLLDARQGLRRPLTEADVQAAPAAAAATPARRQRDLPPVPPPAEPDLVMYVFPHLAGTDPVPVPGYSTVFPLYQRVQYAMPGERVEDY